MIAGFDFGTTNSLVSVCTGRDVIDLFDDDGRPHPSVVRYEGEEVTVGREARNALEAVGLGVHGTTVRSPKMYLGKEVINVGGVDRSPVDIVSDVIRHVRKQSLNSRRGADRELFGDLDRAVVTIPVKFNGNQRAALRESFARAGISVVQFVHEPFAALYGHLRGSSDFESTVRALMRRRVLVVDWGGGTLDLTLCRIEPGRVLQIHNHGTDEVGGDKFDQVIRDAVVTRFTNKNGISPSDRPMREARLRLLQVTEENKIDLSKEPRVTFYRPGYFPESGTDLEYPLSRQELEEITRPLVARGISEIDSLLDVVGISPAEISLCLVAGGMAAMPSIRSSLHELFGPEKVVVPDNSATLVSQGAAWIAHDSQPLVLAKQIELEMARGFLLPLLRSGTAMPTLGQVKSVPFHLYCTDPSDGTAKFSIVAPTELSDQPQVTDRRTSLGIVAIEVDKTAPPMVERLTLDVKIDDDLILSATATSSQRGDRCEASYYDLEFGIGLPGSEELGCVEVSDADAGKAVGGLVARSNVADTDNQALIPGDVLYKHNPRAFQRLPGPNQATDDQLTEHLYYQPCGVCKRPWGDTACRCAS